MLFRTLTDPRWSAALFAAALMAMYCLLPLAVDTVMPSPQFVELATLTVVACASLIAGFMLPLFDQRFRPGAPRLALDARAFHVVVWGAFIVFLVVTFATAPAIPIISALQGADANELSNQRGDFLKMRSGAEVILLYLSTLFVSALLPYSLVGLFIERSRWRYPLTLLFLAFSISFVQKALFVNVVLPLFYFAVRRMRIGTAKTVLIVGASVLLLYAVSLLALGNDRYENTAIGGEFFTAAYVAKDTVDFLIWRSVAVPMFAASDTLVVFREQFNSEPLLGATSTLIAGIFEMERIPFEKLVFEYQWGWNDRGNSNAVFITDAYVNFGWLGVVFMSMFVGQSLRWFHKSRDEAFKSLWLIYCFALFSGSLIGMMLSNGYALMFFMALFVTLKNRSNGRNQGHVSA